MSILTSLNAHGGSAANCQQTVRVRYRNSKLNERGRSKFNPFHFLSQCGPPYERWGNSKCPPVFRDVASRTSVLDSAAFANSAPVRLLVDIYFHSRHLSFHWNRVGWATLNKFHFANLLI